MPPGISRASPSSGSLAWWTPGSRKTEPSNGPIHGCHSQKGALGRRRVCSVVRTYLVAVDSGGQEGRRGAPKEGCTMTSPQKQKPPTNRWPLYGSAARCYILSTCCYCKVTTTTTTTAITITAQVPAQSPGNQRGGRVREHVQENSRHPTLSTHFEPLRWRLRRRLGRAQNKLIAALSLSPLSYYYKRSIATLLGIRGSSCFCCCCCCCYRNTNFYCAGQGNADACE